MPNTANVITKALCTQLIKGHECCSRVFTQSCNDSDTAQQGRFASALDHELQWTPGNTHNISNNRFAPVSAVVPVVSYGGETCKIQRGYYTVAQRYEFYF